MNLGQLLAVLRERDIRLVADGERLRCIAPPGALTAELSAQIKQAKPELLALLANAAGSLDGSATVPRTQPKERFPLSFAQRRAVLAGRISGTLPSAFLLRGELDVPVLDEALTRIVGRHMPLRTRFHLDGDNIEQEALAEVDFELPETDLSDLAEGERRRRLDELLAQLSRVELDVRQPPLFRFSLVRLGPREHVLHTAFSVLVFDGGSLDVFWQELREAYAAITQGEPWPASPLPVTFEDLVAWQHERLDQEGARHEAFWKRALGEELPPLPLPTDRPRPREATTRGRALPFELPRETADAIRQFSQQRSVTPQITMLAALYALLARLGSTRDLVVATPVDARTQASVEGLIGPFANLLLLRATVDLDQGFADLVVRVRELCLAAYEHQALPLERIDVRSPRSGAAGFSPAFQVELSYQQVSRRGFDMAGVSLSPLPVESGAAASDIALWIEDWGERLAGVVELKLDLFEPQTVQHWLRCYQHLIRGLVGNPQVPMRELDLLGDERALLMARLAQLSAAPPAWAVARAGAAARVGSVHWQVIDERNQPVPFGIPGELAVVRDDGTLHRVGAQARLRHDGVLSEVVPDRPPPIPARAAPPSSAIRTELELRLCLLFEQLLGVAGVTPDQDYFDLGGNSLLAVRLFGAIHEQFGVRLPMATLVDAGTPGKLARAINAKTPHRDGCVVRLRAGAGGPALFLIHDGDGETLLYRNLALLMPKQVAVFGIEPVRDGRLPMVHTTIEEAARAYLAEIRGRQPRGPYFLGGLCAGGLIAFEVARQLEAAGEEVGHLALIESSPPGAETRSSEMRQRWQRFGGGFADFSLATAGAKLRQGAHKAHSFLRYDLVQRYHGVRTRALCLLLRNLVPRGKQWPEWLPAPTTREVYTRAERTYVPAPLQRTRAVLYRATRGEGADLPLSEILVDPLLGWKALLAYEPAVVDVPGGHGSLLRHPNVTTIATAMRTVFEADAAVAEAGQVVGNGP